MLPRIVVVGSSNTDLVLQCPRLPRAGETLLGGEFFQHAGGKGANQAVAAARAGAKVTFIGAHGGDAYGKEACARLKNEGIDVRYFRQKPNASSGIALILVGGKARDNIIAVARSANDLLSPGDVAEAGSVFAKAGAVVSQLEIPLPAVAKAAELARENSVPFVLNPAPAQRLPGRLLRQVSVLTPNEHEACILAETEDLHEAGRVLLRRGCGSVVITLGAKGALVCNADGITAVPAFKVRPVDTVGAGDCFTGYLAVAIASHLTLSEATSRASAAAALSITRQGAQSGMPNATEVEKMLASASRRARNA